MKKSLGVFALLAMFFTQVNAAKDPDKGFEVILLGSGSPGIHVDRFSSSNLVKVAGKTFLVDAGRGAAIRMSQVGNPRQLLPSLDGVFLTHLHSDHLMGLSDVYMTGWLYGRNSVFDIYGPPGTKGLMQGLRSAYDKDVYYRSEVDTKYATTGLEVNVTEYSSDRVLVSDGGLKITAFLVDHADIKPAFGYKFEYGGKCAVFSGDTRYSENLIKHSRGCDVVIHEVSQVSDAYLKKRPSFQTILDHHTLPVDVGRVFSRVKPSLGVFNHIIAIDISEQELVDQARETYSGPLMVGHDLMKISLSGDKPTVSDLRQSK
ncbi:MBL fold metallo-hydrolase [uncultured Pseudoteredinibacter sp.]|uniref:MBL fold metallo-hydrolase n=1 Tax=uncultured Pseudoteredinibacter sp. TaxID=1641701 RepID=UPI002620F2C8|nr:MBL fold metallo-hydrolase [uncultured Pseudoteredinibacter sp.]